MAHVLNASNVQGSPNSNSGGMDRSPPTCSVLLVTGTQSFCQGCQLKLQLEPHALLSLRLVLARRRIACAVLGCRVLQESRMLGALQASCRRRR